MPLPWTKDRAWASTRPRPCTCCEGHAAARLQGLGEVLARHELGHQAALALDLHETEHLHQVRVGELRGRLQVGHHRLQHARPGRAPGAACAARRCVRRFWSSARWTMPRGPRPISSLGAKRGPRAAGTAGPEPARGRSGAPAAGRGRGGRAPRLGARGHAAVAWERRRSARSGGTGGPAQRSARFARRGTEVLGTDLLVDGEGLRALPRGLLGHGQPVVEVQRCARRHRLAGDRPSARARRRGPACRDSMKSRARSSVAAR